MPNNFENVSFIVPSYQMELELLLALPPLPPFSEKVIEYLDALHHRIKQDPRTRQYSDVATFAFFCRKSNLNKLKEKFDQKNVVRLGKGVVFHIAPSNVPVNFAFSLVAGLLAGNVNIIKVSSKNFEQVSIIADAMNDLSSESEYAETASRIMLLRYDRTNEMTKQLSQLCDVRIIWGGDETIGAIRKNSLLPRSFDITFADRYSLCIINADNYVGETSVDKIAQAFYNDTYLFDQNACTSPHLVIWLGKKDNVIKSKRIFWHSLHDYLLSKYEIQPVIALDKLSTFYTQAIQMNNVKKEKMDDNLIWRIELTDLESQVDENRCSSGYFSEYHASDLSELSKIVNKKYQTLTYYGLSKDELREIILRERMVGIDRIVPIGRASEFSLIWDGFDLIKSLSRECEIL